jgi:hypothetical protein
LALIALTLTIHAVCVVFMAFVHLSIQTRQESRGSLGLWHGVAILIGTIVRIGLLLGRVDEFDQAKAGGEADD